MRLFCFGYGYTASRLAALLRPEGWSVAGTCRDPVKQADLPAAGVEPFSFPLADAATALAGATHILLSVPPDAARDSGGDPVLRQHGADIAALRGKLLWLGYLSTTGVYGDRDGAWVDETSAVAPTGERGQRRAAAEAAWVAFAESHDLPLQRFRLPGIYGPGRSAIDGLRAGTQQRIDKPGQVFSRIHVDDLAMVLAASMRQPRAGAIYNVADDEPAASAEVAAYGASLLGIEPPPLVPFDSAKLSPMARSFYAENKRVGNALIKSELGVRLKYPTYREGLAACL